MTSTRILYLNYSLAMGGIETLILELCRRMDRQRFAPAVCVLEDGGTLTGEFEALGITVHVLRKGRGVDWSLPWRLADLMRRENTTVLHTHNATAWFYGALAMRLSGVSLVHTEHTSPGHHAVLWRRMETLLALGTRVITAVSESVADEMVKKQGIPARKVHVIRNGIAASEYEGANQAEQVREALGIPKGAFVVGTVARFFPDKDHRTLLNAFKHVADRAPKAILLLIGDGPLQGSVERQAQTLGLNGRVWFLGNRRDVPELLKACDLFALSSVKEGLPIALLEAMAAGLPVVATRVDGNPEAVVHEQTGLLVPARDPNALTEAICRMIADPQTARQMGVSGRKRVNEQFTFTSMVRSYEEVYVTASKKR